MGRLKGFIEDICRQRGKLIIPSFSVGRTQQLVYFLNELHQAKRIPSVPVFVDSPLSSKATAVYAEAHKADPEFYELRRTLGTYRKILDEKTTLLLSADSDLLKFLMSRPKKD